MRGPSGHGHNPVNMLNERSNNDEETLPGSVRMHSDHHY